MCCCDFIVKKYVIMKPHGQYEVLLFLNGVAIDNFQRSFDNVFKSNHDKLAGHHTTCVGNGMYGLKRFNKI